MELRHLRYFVAVAEELHFGRAAVRLHISQPPLSQQIKALEEELGVTLFRRTRRVVSLTDAGKAFLPAARATIEQARRAESLVRDVASGRAGSLAIGFVMSAGYSILPDAIRRFRKAHPDVALILREMIPSEQLEALAKQALDIGILRPPVSAPGISFETLLDEPLVAALPAGHRLAAKRTLRLQQLQDEDWILFPRRHGPGLLDAITHACREAGFSPSVRHEPNDIQSVLAHVAAGLGVSLLPGSLFRSHQDQIVCRHLQAPAPCIALLLARRTGHDTPLIRGFLQHCHAAAMEIPHRNGMGRSG